MWGDLIFPISPFIMPKFADDLTITFLTEMFICKTLINYMFYLNELPFGRSETFEECSTLLSKRKFNVVLEKFSLDSKVEKEFD